MAVRAFVLYNIGVERNIILMFFYWLFVESTARVARGWFFYLRFGLNLFSVPLLLRTFFSPWHRYWYGYPKNFDPAGLFYAIFGNAMSRVIGMILRTILIALGILFDAFVFIIGLAVLIFWITLPFTAIYLFYLGVVLTMSS